MLNQTYTFVLYHSCNHNTSVGCNSPRRMRSCAFTEEIGVPVMAFNATFNNISAISWRFVFLVEYPEKTTNCETLSHNVVSSTPQLSNRLFSGICVTQSLVLYVCFVDCCLSFYTFFFWSLCCLFFFDIRILITPLVSSNSSYEKLRIGISSI